MTLANASRDYSYSKSFTPRLPLHYSSHSNTASLAAKQKPSGDAQTVCGNYRKMLEMPAEKGREREREGREVEREKDS